MSHKDLDQTYWDLHALLKITNPTNGVLESCIVNVQCDFSEQKLVLSSLM